MNEIIRQHFTNPQNMGKLKHATHISKCKSGFCGDTIELFAIVDHHGIVLDVKYNVFGCYAIIAAASALSEWAKGKSIHTINTISSETALQLLGNEIDPEKENCINVATKAFQNLQPIK